MWKLILIVALAAAAFFAWTALKPAAVPVVVAPPPPPPVAPGGRGLYQKGKYAEALPKLMEEAERAGQNPDAADLLDLAAECQVRLGRAADAVPLWERVAKDFPALPAAGRAAARLAEAQEQKGDLEGARARLVAAWKAPGADRDALAKRMIALNQQLLFSKRETKDSVLHVVQPDESLSKLGRKYGMEAEAIQRINGLKKITIFPNDKLKIPRGKFRVDVSKSRRQLWLFYDDSVARMYDVGIGREGHDTPVGEFAIVTKEVKPAWTMTTEDGRRVVVRYGEPGHILGSRWMGFAPPNQDIGIHGIPATEEGTIGKASSKGCIRMRNADVEELYDLVAKKTPVSIGD